jgi:hypothetical protein
MKNRSDQNTANHLSLKDCTAIAKLEDEFSKGRKEREGLLG